MVTTWLQKLQLTQSNLNLSPAEKYYEAQGKILEGCVNFPSTWFELDWVSDWDFGSDVKFEEPHFRNTFRRYFLSQVVAHTERLNLEGLNIEFGVFNGYGSKLILENSTNDLLLVDTFSGMSDPLSIDGEYWSRGDMARELVGYKKDCLLGPIGRSILLAKFPMS